MLQPRHIIAITTSITPHIVHKFLNIYFTFIELSAFIILLIQIWTLTVTGYYSEHGLNKIINDLLCM